MTSHPDHSREFTDVATSLNTDLRSGLTLAESKKRLKEHGPNALEEKEKISPFAVFLNQLKSPFVVLLIVAAGLSVYFGDTIDAIAIAAVIVMNAVIGFSMEYQAERSMAALKKMTVVPAKVIREGELREIRSDEVVPGDVLFVEAGDIILADARLFEHSQLQVDESSLTGESLPVEKQAQPVPSETPLAERTNMLFKGTHVTKGNGKAIVIRTGMKTELGKIASMVQAADSEATPLEQKIQQFSRKLIGLTLVLIILIFLAGLIRGVDLTKMITTSIALAVAAIPEGLPIVTTLALARGMLRMARQRVIVKRLSAVETLGGTTVICTDKTGTLTQNHIEVTSVRIGGREALEENTGDGDPGLEMVRLVSALCNTAEISREQNETKDVGDPLETGLLRFVKSGGGDIDTLRRKHGKVAEEPFSSETRMMATAHEYNGTYLTCAKGAVDELLAKCTHEYTGKEPTAISEKERKSLSEQSTEMAASGLRVIGMAYRQTDDVPRALTEKLVFIGLVGMLDPLRKEVPDAIKECKNAGIKVIMITGDHPATARNIGQKLGLVDAKDQPIVTGSKMKPFEELDDVEKKEWLQTRIFARVSPQQKLDLVKLLQEQKEIVGMTGDGVNDAPALKKADIGIAMGLRGTQVAQEVSDMVLKDDSFSSIVTAIRQGRVIFENIRKFIVFLLSCNLSELVLIAITAIANAPFALLPIQILYINLVTDVLPALALGVTRGGGHVMNQKPRNTAEPIISRQYWKALVIYSVNIALASLAAVLFAGRFGDHTQQADTGFSNNILFITLIFSQLLHVFNVTSDIDQPFFKTEIMRNRFIWLALGICTVITLLSFVITPLARALRLESLSLLDWTVIAGFSVLSMIVNWSLKKFKVIK